MQWRIVGKDGIIVEVMEVVGVEVVVYCSSATCRYTIPFLKRYRVARHGDYGDYGEQHHRERLQDDDECDVRMRELYHGFRNCGCNAEEKKQACQTSQ